MTPTPLERLARKRYKHELATAHRETVQDDARWWALAFAEMLDEQTEAWSETDDDRSLAARAGFMGAIRFLRGVAADE